MDSYLVIGNFHAFIPTSIIAPFAECIINNAKIHSTNNFIWNDTGSGLVFSQKKLYNYIGGAYDMH